MTQQILTRCKTENSWTVYIPVAGLDIGDLDIEMNNDTITIICDVSYKYG